MVTVMVRSSGLKLKVVSGLACVMASMIDSATSGENELVAVIVSSELPAPVMVAMPSPSSVASYPAGRLRPSPVSVPPVAVRLRTMDLMRPSASAIAVSPEIAVLVSPDVASVAKSSPPVAMSRSSVGASLAPLTVTVRVAVALAFGVMPSVMV